MIGQVAGRVSQEQAADFGRKVGQACADLKVDVPDQIMFLLSVAFGLAATHGISPRGFLDMAHRIATIVKRPSRVIITMG